MREYVCCGQRIHHPRARAALYMGNSNSKYSIYIHTARRHLNAHGCTPAMMENPLKHNRIRLVARVARAQIAQTAARARIYRSHTHVAQVAKLRARRLDPVCVQCVHRKKMNVCCMLHIAYCGQISTLCASIIIIRITQYRTGEQIACR